MVSAPKEAEGRSLKAVAMAIGGCVAEDAKAHVKPRRRRRLSEL